jgi:hypothetical protein
MDICAIHARLLTCIPIEYKGCWTVYPLSNRYDVVKRDWVSNDHVDVEVNWLLFTKNFFMIDEKFWDPRGFTNLIELYGVEERAIEFILSELFDPRFLKRKTGKLCSIAQTVK